MQEYPNLSALGTGFPWTERFLSNTKSFLNVPHSLRTALSWISPVFPVPSISSPSPSPVLSLWSLQGVRVCHWICHCCSLGSVPVRGFRFQSLGMWWFPSHWETTTNSPRFGIHRFWDQPFPATLPKLLNPSVEWSCEMLELLPSSPPAAPWCLCHCPVLTCEYPHFQVHQIPQGDRQVKPPKLKRRKISR